MDPNLILRILQRARQNQTPNQNPTNAASSQAPMPQAPGMAQAYQNPMQGQQGQQAPATPFAFNPGLEQQAQAGGMQQPLNPMVQQIMQRLGLLGMMRNQTNQQGASLSQI